MLWFNIDSLGSMWQYICQKEHINQAKLKEKENLVFAKEQVQSQARKWSKEENLKEGKNFRIKNHDASQG
jgi:hypothetical protein